MKGQLCNRGHDRLCDHPHDDLHDHLRNRATLRLATRKRLALYLMVTGLAAVPMAHAQQGLPSSEMGDFRGELNESRAKLEALHQSILKQERELAENRRSLEAERRRVEALLGRISGRGTAPADTSVPPVAQVNPETPRPVGQGPDATQNSRPLEVAPIFQQPGVLTPKGRGILEPSLQYAHSTDNRVSIVGFSVIPAINIGLIDVRRVNRDIWTASLTGRYGLTNRMEIEARVPYVRRYDSTVTRPIGTPSVADSAFDAQGQGLGDVEGTLRYQLNDGGADRPYYVGSLRVKSNTGKSPFEVDFDTLTRLQRTLPTGSGFWGLQPGLTVLIPSDPAVLFAGVSYLYNFSRDVGNGFGRIQPGGIFGFNFGLGLGLNDKATFSIGYDHATVLKSRQEDPNATNQLGIQTTTQLGTLLFGLAYRYTPTTNFNLSLGVGVTRDAPDLQLTLRVPTTF